MSLPVLSNRVVEYKKAKAVPLVKKMPGQFIFTNTFCCKPFRSQRHSLRTRSSSMSLEITDVIQTVAADRQGGRYCSYIKTCSVSEMLVVRCDMVRLCLPAFLSSSPVFKIRRVCKRCVLCNTEIR